MEYIYIKYNHILIGTILIFLLTDIKVYGQCAANTNSNGSSDTQDCTMHQRRIGSGEYANFSVTRCRNYLFEIQPPPSNTGWSMTLTLRETDGTLITHVAGTGVRRIFWTATFTGTVRAHVNRNCLGFQEANQAANSAYLRYRDHGDLANNAAGWAATPTPGTWRGGVSTAWTTATNWDCGTIPNSTTEVNIPAPCVNNPTLNGNGNVRCIRINAPAVLTKTATGTLTVHGNSLTGRCQ